VTNMTYRAYIRIFIAATNSVLPLPLNRHLSATSCFFFPCSAQEEQQSKCFTCSFMKSKKQPSSFVVVRAQTRMKSTSESRNSLPSDVYYHCCYSLGVAFAMVGDISVFFTRWTPASSAWLSAVVMCLSVRPSVCHKSVSC